MNKLETVRQIRFKPEMRNIKDHNGRSGSNPNIILLFTNHKPCLKAERKRKGHISFLNYTTVGGSQSTRREPMHARGEHANSMQKDPGQKLNPGPSCCKATVLPTVALCSPPSIFSLLYFSFY
ncbi:hypothetical protein GOODEAATRI_034466 [Goodea atripinnis]|uniref:Uncharacterized protein n=1 Tax=Goodea atripinnis TaxID=208336 RepID=A0ABV0P2T3_9TELE